MADTDRPSTEFLIPIVLWPLIPPEPVAREGFSLVFYSFGEDFGIVFSFFVHIIAVILKYACDVMWSF